jgi:superoxide dismutase, Cu-Zn family
MNNKIIPISIALFFVGTQILSAQMDQMKREQSAVKRAIAVMTPTKGNSVQGTVTFEEGETGVRVIASLTGLKQGKHGFHVHEFGDISSVDGSSAGGHFNPSSMPHSMPMSAKRHAGDMGNIEADEQGTAHLDYVDRTMKLSGITSIIGHTVVIHEKEDDLKTQPTGNAGARIGYGVIGIAK